MSAYSNQYQQEYLLSLQDSYPMPQRNDPAHLVYGTDGKPIGFVAVDRIDAKIKEHDDQIRVLLGLTEITRNAERYGSGVNDVARFTVETAQRIVAKQAARDKVARSQEAEMEREKAKWRKEWVVVGDKDEVEYEIV